MHCGPKLRKVLEAIEEARRSRRKAHFPHVGILHEAAPVLGNVLVEVRRAGSGELLHEERVKNRVTGAGRDVMRNLILNVGGAPGYLAIGTGGTTTADDMVALEAEIFRAAITRRIAGTSRAIFKIFLASTDANQRFTGLAWTRSGTTATITRNGHGLANGAVVNIEDSSDTAALPNNASLVSGVTTNTYNVPAVNIGATSGTCTEWSGKSLQEIGLFVGTNFSLGAQPLLGGTLFARATFTPIVKDSTIELTVTWEMVVTSSS